MKSEEDHLAPRLPEHLASLPYKDLRGMASRLGLRARRQRKADWVARIAAGWQEAGQRQQWLGALSTAARAAIARLLQAEQIPAALFWAEYGPVRQVRGRQHWTPPPWQTPGNVSEELYYSGLLCLARTTAAARPGVVTLPAEVHTALSPALLPTAAATPAAPPSASPFPWAICHDVGQLLIYLQSQAQPGGPPPLWHGRWLPRRQMAALNQQLLQPLAATRAPSHRSSPYLRLLSFLSEAGELQTQGVLTPKGWAWLAAAPAAQLAWLWQAWQEAAAQQRRRYALPGAAAGAPWPQPLVRQLHSAASRPRFTPEDLVHAMLGGGGETAAFWTANFQALHDLDQVVAQTLAEVLQPLGVVAPAHPPCVPPSLGRTQGGSAGAHPAGEASSPVYQVTSAGLALLSGQPVGGAADTLAAGAVLRPEPESGALLLDLPALPLPGILHAQARLALVGDYAPPPTRSPQAYHRYRLAAATLARAAAAGQSLPDLLQALATLAVPLTPELLEQLHAWHDQGRQLALAQLPLLRTSTPAQLAAILQERTLAAAVGEVLAPTVATVTQDLAAFARQLQRFGHYAAWPPAQPTPAGNAAATAALWLAGRVYASLADHLPLPLPPPYAELDRLLATLSPAQQAVLQAQARQLHEQLLDLLDNLPFTPPPQPSDPAQWRLPIAQAIDAGQKLLITYFSAGRNLTTQRLVEPYWIEEHRGVPYLRAYCHSAGRVLTFRLDRIASLAV